MKITWLGQAGLMFEKDGFRIMVDPYLSDSVKKVNPLNYRRVPVDEQFLKMRPDVLILTHNHIDHTDPETLPHYLEKFSDITVLASENAWQEARKYGHGHNYVMFNRHTEWSCCGMKFTAVKAEHSDTHAVGVIIDDGEKKYYITGDTLYNTDIFTDIPDDIYAMFVPVNGVGNNLNFEDASRLAEKVNPVKAVPLHFGMFDELNPENFKYKNRVIPVIYKEINL